MKRVGREELETVAGKLRAEGKRIVFTNGCFDVLHPGHIYSLCEARALGDILFVGLNSDDSVRNLKGEGRPIFPEDQRAEVLEAMEVVDFVTIFSEDTPLRVIEAVRPDVLVKGGDYTEETVVGRDFVESNGGRLVIVTPLPGFSSSRIISEIDAIR